MEGIQYANTAMKNGATFHSATTIIAPTTVIQRSFCGTQSKRTIKISSAPIIAHRTSDEVLEHVQ